MPQNTQHTLIHVLLFWTTILTISQIVFIVLLFTGGHHGPFQNKSTEALGHSMHSQAVSPPLSSCKSKHEWGMLSFTAVKVTDKVVKWKPRSTDSDLISEEGLNLKIKKDGYFFLTFQVTSESCSTGNVMLKWGDNTLLEGMINRNTCSTGLLGKVQTLSAGDSLKVTINSSLKINTCEHCTHLDVIYLCKP